MKRFLRVNLMCLLAVALCLACASVAFASVPFVQTEGGSISVVDDRADVVKSLNQDQKKAPGNSANNAGDGSEKKEPSPLMLIAFFGMDVVIVASVVIYYSRRNKQAAMKSGKSKGKSKSKSKKSKRR